MDLQICCGVTEATGGLEDTTVELAGLLLDDPEDGVEEAGFEGVAEEAGLEETVEETLEETAELWLAEESSLEADSILLSRSELCDRSLEATSELMVLESLAMLVVLEEPSEPQPANIAVANPKDKKTNKIFFIIENPPKKIKICPIIISQ